MQCPKCGFQQVESEICEACGIVFAKYEERRSSITPEAALDTASDSKIAPNPDKESYVKTMIIVVLAIALGLMAGKVYFEKSAESPDAPLEVVQQQDAVSEPMLQEPNISFQQPTEAPYPTPPGENNPVTVNHGSSNSIAAARNATVYIETPWGSGSGFFVDNQGHVITNRHVVKFDQAKLRTFRQKLEELENALEKEKKIIKNLKERLEKVTDEPLREKITNAIRAKEDHYNKYDRLYWKLQEQRRNIEYSDYPAAIKVVTLSGQEFTAYEIDYSENFDLALLTLDGFSQEPIKPNFRRLSPGATVYSIGNPSGLRHTVTAGIISGYRTYNKVGTVIQTDAPINPGNSGGPLIDEQGHVLGVNTMIVNNTEGIGFAISIKDVWDEFPGKIAP